MTPLPRCNDPVTFVVFGATGDLFKRKIIPSLYLLYHTGNLPDVFSIVGFGRQNHTNESFRKYVHDRLAEVVPGATEAEAAPFLELFEYYQGEFSDTSTFDALNDALVARDRACSCTTLKSFYLAVPPEQVRALVPQIAHVAPRKNGAPSVRQIIIEKPFGHDEESAQALNKHLHAYFDESEIYRIDHYLAKPGLEHLLHARVKHDRYDALLKEEPITGIDISLYETLGVEKRGAFYDSVGTLRDVGQNHLLEMLALAVMPLPEMRAKHICRSREAFITSLPRLSTEHAAAHSKRAQYAGYRAIPGVAPDSEVETFFRLDFKLAHEPYKGVSVTLASGKRMPHVEKEIIIRFNCDHTDSLHIELEPMPRLYTKKDGRITPIETFEDPEPNIQYANEYASLFSYAWRGDITYFPTEREVEAAWRFVDPVLAAWKGGVPPLETYEPDKGVPYYN
ncbi:MAG: hypothetical protein ACE5F4_02720 [Candidatus Paceibacteria bacterium]